MYKENYTIVQKFGIGDIYLIKNCNIVDYYYNSKALSYFDIFKIIIYSCDGKADVLADITPVFNATWSFRNSSNMLISLSRNSSYDQCWKKQKLKQIF